MGLHTLPPEILLKVVKFLKPDRRTLRSLRLVNRSMCPAATEVLFEDLSVHYGLTRSNLQIKGLLEAPTLYWFVKTLFLPSESFFPISKDLFFSEKIKFPWTRNPEDSTEATRSGNSEHQLYLLAHPELFRESPKRPWVSYDPKRLKYKRQHDTYLANLANLIKALPNIQRIHIAIGLFLDSHRMLAWLAMFEEMLWEVIASIDRIVEVEISTPVAKYRDCHALEPFCGQDVTFPNVKSFKMNFHHCSRDPPRYYVFQLTRQPLVQSAASLFSNFQNITSYTLSRSPNVFPPSSIRTNLTSLYLNNMSLEVRIPRILFTEFKEAVADCFNLEYLDLDTIAIHGVKMRKVSTGRFLLIKFDDQTGKKTKVATDFFPSGGWFNILAAFMKSLKLLKKFRFQRLVYGQELRSVRSGSESGILEPVLVPVKGMGNGGLPDGLCGWEIISPFKRDYLALEKFRKAVEGKGEEESSRDDEEQNKAPKFKRYGCWQFLHYENLLQ
ncbi:hypothetical protein TWF718_002282 [Orbilia javanica]|uniref:F-box domain-containing protein n=1 Tax=Orbilia javanica TaxID=47235 RepID=A0AAN8RC85_9PEZI